MSPVLVWAGAGLAVLAVVLSVVPRLLLQRAQDRLASRLLEGEAGSAYRLLTRAELVAGPRRRLPGVLGLTADSVVFLGLFGERELVATSRISKIITGRRLSSGRTLLRQEVLRIARPAGDELEVVLTRAAAGAWRSHLGLWAIEERKASMDTVTPGKK